MKGAAVVFLRVRRLSRHTVYLASSMGGSSRDNISFPRAGARYIGETILDIGLDKQCSDEVY